MGAIRAKSKELQMFSGSSSPSPYQAYKRKPCFIATLIRSCILTPKSYQRKCYDLYCFIISIIVLKNSQGISSLKNFFCCVTQQFFPFYSHVGGKYSITMLHVMKVRFIHLRSNKNNKGDNKKAKGKQNNTHLLCVSCFPVAWPFPSHPGVGQPLL